MTDTLKAIVYVHSTHDQMYYKGVELGLTGDALEMFKFACSDVRVELSVEPKTGVARIVSVDERKVEA